MAKCVVLGGSGFIGRHLVEKLVKDGHEVTVFSRKPQSYTDYDVSNVTGDFMNIDDIDRAIMGGEYVFHLISLTNPASSAHDPYIDLDTNVKMTIHLLQSCVRHKVKRVIFTSSGGAIYGVSNKELISEETSTLPLSPYGIGKATIEGYLRYFNAVYGLDYLSLRISNAYGEGQDPAKGNHGVVPIFLSHVLKNENIMVMGDGTMSRDYIYVKDLTDFIAKIFDKPHNDFVYNVGSGRGLTVNDVVAYIERVTGKKASIIRTKAPESFVPKVVLDTSRAVNEFGKISVTGFEDGVRNIYRHLSARS